jgi:hypothetical protein
MDLEKDPDNGGSPRGFTRLAVAARLEGGREQRRNATTALGTEVQRIGCFWAIRRLVCEAFRQIMELVAINLTAGTSGRIRKRSVKRF